MATSNLASITKQEQELSVLSLLKRKSILMRERPLTLIFSRKLFRGTTMKYQNLEYREERRDGHDGFFTNLDPVSKRKRIQKLIEGKNNDEVKQVKEKDSIKYRQVAAVPTEWTWNFSWKDIPHPALKPFLTGKESRFNFRHPLKRQKKELIDHLACEMFFYFRKGIPHYYMNKMLDKLLQDYPSFSDDTTWVGYVSSMYDYARTFHFLSSTKFHSFGCGR